MNNIISKFALPFVIATIIFLIISGNLFSPSPLIITVQLLAVALNMWARMNFHSKQFSINAEPLDGPLLSTGPYKFVRHPMYTSALLLVWASILGHISAITLSIGVLVIFVVTIRIIMEERFLRGNFPEYIDYSKKTKAIIPFIL